MNYKRLIAVTVLTILAFTGSNVMARGGGGGGGHGGFGVGGFRGGGFSSGFRGGSNGTGFRGGFRGDRFRHREFHDRFFFFSDFGDPFLYYPYPYYGYYPYGYYPYAYGYDSYNEPGYEDRAGYSDSLVGQVQLRLARAGYYRGAIDGARGNATRRAIGGYERAHGLPRDGRISQQLLTSMGLG